MLYTDWKYVGSKGPRKYETTSLPRGAAEFYLVGARTAIGLDSKTNPRLRPVPHSADATLLRPQACTRPEFMVNTTKRNHVSESGSHHPCTYAQYYFPPPATPTGCVPVLRHSTAHKAAAETLASGLQAANYCRACAPFSSTGTDVLLYTFPMPPQNVLVVGDGARAVAGNVGATLAVHGRIVAFGPLTVIRLGVTRNLGAWMEDIAPLRLYNRTFPAMYKL